MTDTHAPTTTQEQKLQVLNSNHKRLMELQKSLDEALDAFGRDVSTITQMATYWGQKPIWQRAGIGIAVIVPLLGVLNANRRNFRTKFNHFFLFHSMGFYPDSTGLS